ncbi:MAG: ATP-binding cassette domain-containing protein [Lachnospiraceae bacterium]|nr:ATP-binding cassette domain-containing protein [Lachnospiraceae bacterium]
MILKYDLPEAVTACLTLEKGERIYYAVPYDIAEDGSWLADSYFVVSTGHLFLVSGVQVVEKLNISDCRMAKAEPKIGGGILVLTHRGITRYLVHYSAKHLSRYAYIARGINILISGRTEEVVSTEYEKICPQCGRAIPGTRYCPHCSKEGGFWRSFLKMSAPYKKKFSGIIVLMILAAVVTLLNPEVQKHLVDKVLTKGNGGIGVAFTCLGIMFALSVGIVVINVLKSYYCTVLGAIIAKDLRQELFAKIQILSLSFINDRRPGELMNRIVYDTRRIREFMERTFCNMFTVCFIFVCDIVFMFALNVKLAFLSLIFVPLAVIFTYAFRKNIHRRFHLQWKKDDDVNSNLQDVISGMRVVKSYGKEEAEKKKFNVLSEEFCRVQTRNEVFWAIFNPFTGLIMGAGVFLVIYFGGMDVFGGSMTTGELLQFITYTQLLYQYLNWMTSMPRDLMNLISSIERINDVLAQEPFIEDVERPVDLQVKGAIEFRHATFGYKSYQPVLEDLNLTIRPGEMIGIVGASGTGKSTLINLIMRLYEVDDGSLMVDGHDIKEIRSDTFHSQIGVVLQETFLFSGTILDNIRFSRPEATYEEVVRAAKMANAHDFISKTPDGYNTYVGEKGYNLSGGERQRIAIARAILNEPRLLILDEATASLDTESEFMIQKALERLTNGRTTFAIAHRLSTLQNADRLIVIDGHQIAEIGSHDELLQKEGIYYRLVKAQLEMQGTEAG